VLNRRLFLLTSLSLPLARGFAASKPKQILLIRHAEKTSDKADAHLDPRGYERAAALPRLFPAQFETPRFIFATRASAHSNRPYETVSPLARALKLKINAQFRNEDYAAFAKYLFSTPAYSGATVLVCWHHGHIPALAKALGVEHPPSPWPDKQFDRVWKIEYPEGSVGFADLPQQLLPGDSR
jgi:hypothetical protein